MGNKILPSLVDYLIDIGVAVSQDKIKDALQEKQARERITDFIERQAKYNFSCSLDEEIDFGALAEYMKGELICDLRMRLRGTKVQRTAAHITITSKVKDFAKARTVEVPLWGQQYKIPISRKYLSVRLKDFAHLMQKVDILDNGEEIIVEFIPGAGNEGVWEDRLYNNPDDLPAYKD